ncbi:hypothetical protein [Lacticaseibacillus baoqingensis]|uniref:hypothetical protein n=1 Tax=Lacticaseibacillus baoqingensis TaxID=2486013 RepID=UPI0013DE66EA|nr:hypothetical protein [Lacticaseibacillus baoqingensis]
MLSLGPTLITLNHDQSFGGDAYDNFLGIQPSVAFVITRDLYFLVDIHMSGASLAEASKFVKSFGD